MKIQLTLLLALSLFLFSCSKKEDKETNKITKKTFEELEIPTQTINKSSLRYKRETSTWILDEELFSGYALSYYPDSTRMEKIGILNGRKQNESIKWYPDGHTKNIANYHKGKLHGEKKAWSIDSTHQLISHLNYYLGKAHGEQKKWYSTGEIFKIIHLNYGKEEGIQQAFRKNGDLFANYEAKNGRIFGLKKASLCFGLDDEKIQHEK